MAETPSMLALRVQRQVEHQGGVDQMLAGAVELQHGHTVVEVRRGRRETSTVAGE